uniref:Salivary toxin-like peptide n=3 Tax=Nyssomyia TaxID=252611 RepID=J7HF13_9DIPT
MDSKFVILCFLIAININEISSLPSSLPEDPSLSRTKRDEPACKKIFGKCGRDQKCCKHLYCGAFATCWWNGDVYVGTQQIAHGK